MKLAKFERREAERCGVTIEHLREFHEITPCDCGEPKCKGWQVRYRFGTERRRVARNSPPAMDDVKAVRDNVSHKPLYG